MVNTIWQMVHSGDLNQILRAELEPFPFISYEVEMLHVGSVSMTMNSYDKHDLILQPAPDDHGTADRRMWPIVLSWASTVHKMQGSSLDHAVVYLGYKFVAANIK
ncbi:unnamed protein product [Euphydryas editha]|uniref:ATP-dependent DNA helicase n=1 Tax=Euphydryas editha TaxID=104508 RepID=A0AAU9VBH4_EUPED|nr:unnamed protein product [Euphydryas editha]